jgi:NAD(P)H-quinone oxidoreductase subunit 5
MNTISMLLSASALAPTVVLAVFALLAHLRLRPERELWRVFRILMLTLLISSILTALGHQHASSLPTGLKLNVLGVVMTVLVQFLGTVIGSFSSRYLQGEPAQSRYLAALATVMSAVHLLLISDHWLVLIASWSLVGAALQHLLCFYPERAFARLAAHKKKLADVLADGLLIAAASLAWLETGSGRISALGEHIASQGMSLTLHLSMLALVLAVILRTALLPVHGWLIQVMEAPTPVSALLHAGVVNLGGFVLIRFAPILEHAMPARTVLLVFGLTTAVLAGMVMLTRISIKVRLAWSTVAQMGFMLLECALGLYTLAALHLMGHSLYKAHAFLAASTVVRQTRRESLWAGNQPRLPALLIAPLLTASAVVTMQTALGHAPWPWWWSAILGLAWAPMLWFKTRQGDAFAPWREIIVGWLMVCALTAAALLAHSIPLDIHDTHSNVLGVMALLGMFLLYCALVLMQFRPHAMVRWQRWSYAGFYIDEIYTRTALRIWPAEWTAGHGQNTFGDPVHERLQ